MVFDCYDHKKMLIQQNNTGYDFFVIVEMTTLFMCIYI